MGPPVYKVDHQNSAAIGATSTAVQTAFGPDLHTRPNSFAPSARKAGADHLVKAMAYDGSWLTGHGFSRRIADLENEHHFHLGTEYTQLGTGQGQM